MKVELGYIRFGKIPETERSERGNGVVGDARKVIGYEEGVSVWHAVKIKDKWCLVAPHGNSCTHGDFSAMAFPFDRIGCSKEQDILLVDGDEVGIGFDGEPLLRNVKIMEQLPFDYFDEVKQI